MKSNVSPKIAAKAANPVQGTAKAAPVKLEVHAPFEMLAMESSPAANRFDTKPGQYRDFWQWMRKNLTQAEMNDLMRGRCAFHPFEGLEGASKTHLEAFYVTFKNTFDSAEGVRLYLWCERFTSDPDWAVGWVGWSQEDRELALLVSDVLSDFADDDEVNPDACADLAEDECGLEELKEMLIDWLNSDDKTLNKHAHKVAEIAGVDLAALR